MEDLFSNSPTPDGWSESEPTDEESVSSNESETERDKSESFAFMKKLRMAVEPPRFEIVQNPDQMIENPVQIMENPGQLIENPVQIMEHPVQIMERAVHILDNPVQIMENGAQIMNNPVQIMNNPAQMINNPAQIMDNPAIIIVDNPGQILINPNINLGHNIEFVQDPIQYPEPPTPITKKPKIPDADPDTLSHYMVCQKFRVPGWTSVRYARVQDQFEASPGFCALKPNDLLAELTPDSKYNELLKRFDLTCGAMVNGLLQNTMIFRETVKDLPRNMQNKVSKLFHGQESKFRQNSDGLLQYTCGRRQEIIQDRRKLYKPRNKIHKEALYEIPPSETHLFEDDAFTDFVARVKGIDKIFPTEKKRRMVYRKYRENQEHGHRRKMSRAANRQGSNPE